MTWRAALLASSQEEQTQEASCCNLDKHTKPQEANTQEERVEQFRKLRRMTNINCLPLLFFDDGDAVVVSLFFLFSLSRSEVNSSSELLDSCS